MRLMIFQALIHVVFIGCIPSCNSIGHKKSVTVTLKYIDPATTTSIPVGCDGFYSVFGDDIDSVQTIVNIDSTDINVMLSRNKALTEDYILLAKAVINIKSDGRNVNICMDNGGVFYRDDLGYAFINENLRKFVYRFFPEKSGWSNFSRPAIE